MGWDEYAALARQLDASRRADAGQTAQAGAAAQQAREELQAIRNRLGAQHGRITDLCRRIGDKPPPLVPSQAELSTAMAATIGVAPGGAFMHTPAYGMPALGQTPASGVPAMGPTPARGQTPASGIPALGHTPVSGVPGVAPRGGGAGGPAAAIGALRVARQSLDAADAKIAEAELGAAGPGRLGRLSVPVRNSVVYGSYAFVSLLVQLVIVAFARDLPVGTLLAPACGVMPLGMFIAGYSTIGRLFHPGPGEERLDRSPILGIGICALPLAAACAGFFILTWFGG